MQRSKLSKKEIGNIAAACIFISLGIGFTSIIALSFQGIFNGNIIIFPTMFIFATLVWASIIFALVILSPLFRKFFLKWFAINEEDEQTKLLKEILSKQERIESFMILKKEEKSQEQAT